MSETNSREGYLASIEAAVGGTYRMQDGRDFWMDAQVAREVAVRAADGASAWIRRHEPAECVNADLLTVLKALRAALAGNLHRQQCLLADADAAIARAEAQTAGQPAESPAGVVVQHADGYAVRHLDGDAENNDLDNLRVERVPPRSAKAEKG